MLFDGDQTGRQYHTLSVLTESLSVLTLGLLWWGARRSRHRALLLVMGLFALSIIGFYTPHPKDTIQIVFTALLIYFAVPTAAYFTVADLRMPWYRSPRD